MSIHKGFVYRQAVRHNIPGNVHFYTFSCQNRLPLLTNDLWRCWLADAITDARKKLEYDLWAYVFMPEHVHLLIYPRREKYRISEFMQLVKAPVSRRVITSLKKSNSPLLKKLEVRRGDGKIEHRFWLQGGGHDLNIWTMKKAVEKAEYCHHNPVKRELVKSPEQWHWSSYRWLELGSKDNEPLKVDDWIE